MMGGDPKIAYRMTPVQRKFYMDRVIRMYSRQLVIHAVGLPLVLSFFALIVAKLAW